jgi:hypothetical protein
LRYYTQPPEKGSQSDGGEILSSDLLQTFTKEFDLDAIENDVKTLVEELPEETMNVDTLFTVYKKVPLEDTQMDIDDTHDVVVMAGTKKTDEKTQAQETAPLKSLEIDGNVQLNRAIKKASKKRKRLEKKTTLRANKLGDAFAALGKDDPME